MSDYHKLIVTVLKTTFVKAEAKEIIYRNYKNFDNTTFKTELQNKLDSINNCNYLQFETTFMTMLEKHAPLKKKIVRANNVPYMSKTLRKAIMKRSALENKYYKNNNHKNQNLYKKQNNYCSRLYKKEKRKLYSNLNHSNITDNNKFWKTIKPFLSDKGQSTQKITLINNNDTIISDDTKVANTMNEFFSKAVTLLNLTKNSYLLTDTISNDPISNIIEKYKNHPSIINIKENKLFF